MAEKEQQTYHPAPANGYSRSDVEAGAAESKELRRKKRMKCLLYIVIFAVFQIGVITLFSMTVMKVRTPKFRVRSATFGTFDVQESNPSFNLKMNAELGVKNTNFGPYKYDESTIYFYYKGTQVGSSLVPRSKASFRSTKKLTVAVDLSSATLPSNSMLGSDLTSRVLPLTCQSKLSGKVELMMIFKKKKAVDLNCTMEIDIPERELRNIQCK